MTYENFRPVARGTRHIHASYLPRPTIDLRIGERWNVKKLVRDAKKPHFMKHRVRSTVIRRYIKRNGTERRADVNG